MSRLEDASLRQDACPIASRLIAGPPLQSQPRWKICGAFWTIVLRQIGTLSQIIDFSEGLAIAIDMRLICHYDRKPDDETTSSKSKNATTYFKRYITARYVNRRICLNLGAFSLKMSESVPKYTGLLLDVLAAANIKANIILFDREFFSVDAINSLQKRGIEFPMPCRNADNAVAARREFEQDTRPAVFENILANSRLSYRIHHTNNGHAEDKKKRQGR